MGLRIRGTSSNPARATEDALLLSLLSSVTSAAKIGGAQQFKEAF